MQGEPDFAVLVSIIVPIAWFLAVLATVLWAWIVVDVVQREFPQPGTKTKWLLVVLLGGWVGGWIYYIVGMDQGTRPGRDRKPPAPPPKTTLSSKTTSSLTPS